MRVLSFGGGVQSVTIAYMCINGDLPKPDYAIFADPQWESKATYDYIERMKPDMAKAGFPLIVGTKGDIKKDCLEDKSGAGLPFFTLLDGERGMLDRQCTVDYKVMVVRREIRKLMDKIEKVELWLGISRDEAIRIKPSRVGYISHYYPLIEKDMSRQGCKAYLKSHNIPEPPKSACIGCPFHADDFWREMQKKSPVEFEEVCQFDEQMRLRTRTSLKSEVYLHRSCKPLRDIKFDDGNYELWGEECEGHCGL